MCRVDSGPQHKCQKQGKKQSASYFNRNCVAEKGSGTEPYRVRNCRESNQKRLRARQREWLDRKSAGEPHASGHKTQGAKAYGEQAEKKRDSHSPVTERGTGDGRERVAQPIQGIKQSLPDAAGERCSIKEIDRRVPLGAKHAIEEWKCRAAELCEQSIRPIAAGSEEPQRPSRNDEGTPDERFPRRKDHDQCKTNSRKIYSRGKLQPRRQAQQHTCQQRNYCSKFPLILFLVQ